LSHTKKLRPALGGEGTAALKLFGFCSLGGRVHGFSTGWQQFGAVPFMVSDDVGIALRRSWGAPAAGRNQALQVGAAEAAHPGCPGVAEGVERHPGQPVGRHNLLLATLWPRDRRQAACVAGGLPVGSERVTQIRAKANGARIIVLRGLAGPDRRFPISARAPRRRGSVMNRVLVLPLWPFGRRPVMLRPA
jgi:hypothetical protein